jgi:succinate dehydrogenase / fumarate reductase cytochrome b subunit
MEQPPRPSLLAVTKKIVMAITGLALCLFLIGHLAGNTLLFFPGEDGQFNWFNTYSGTLNAVPILWIIELGLLAIFLIHAFEGFMVWRENKAARPIGYQGGKRWAREKSGKSHKSTSSTMMMWTGIVILLFVSVHVWQMKYHNSIGPNHEAAAMQAKDDNIRYTEGIRAPDVEEPAPTASLAMHVVYEFKKPYVALLYMFCMIALGLHLNHAVWSSFQTLGATDSKVRRFMVGFGKLFTVVIAGGFFLIPLWAWFFVEVPK